MKKKKVFKVPTKKYYNIEYFIVSPLTVIASKREGLHGSSPLQSGLPHRAEMFTRTLTGINPTTYYVPQTVLSAGGP